MIDDLYWIHSHTESFIANGKACDRATPIEMRSCIIEMNYSVNIQKLEGVREDLINLISVARDPIVCYDKVYLDTGKWINFISVDWSIWENSDIKTFKANILQTVENIWKNFASCVPDRRH